MKQSAYETVERIRNSFRHARPNPSENPAWANCHMDCGILLAEIDRLRAELSGYERWAASVNEALNSGDGSYRP